MQTVLNCQQTKVIIMKKTIVLLLQFLFSSNLIFAQTLQIQPLVSEELALKNNVKRVVVTSRTSIYNNYHKAYQHKPSKTIIEYYNKNGKITTSIQTNNINRKTISQYFYKKNHILVKTTTSWWKPISKRVSNEPDTMYKKSKAKYTLNGILIQKKIQHRHIHEPDEYIYDSLGRIQQSSVTFLSKGCGRVNSYYQYGKNGKLKEVKKVEKIHNHIHQTSTITYEYNSLNQLVLIYKDEHKHKITLTTFSNHKNGLIKSKTQKVQQLPKPEHQPDFTTFEYDYSFR